MTSEARNSGPSRAPLRAALLCSICALVAVDVAIAEPVLLVPTPSLDTRNSTPGLQTAVLAGGCFWGVEGVFEHVRGVRNVVSGYAGGEPATGRHETAGSSPTGRAESVQVTFDPAVVSYGELLRIFFSVAHDPTQLNRQGPDQGAQYRSAVFYADDTQRDIATHYIEQLNGAKLFSRPIVTRVDPLDEFHPAESYHQDFVARNPHHPYVVVNDLPKLRNLRQLFPERFRETPHAQD